MNTEKKRFFVLLVAVLGVGLTLLTSEIAIRPAYAATFSRTATAIETSGIQSYFPELDLYIVVDDQAGDLSAYDEDGVLVWTLTTGMTLPKYVFDYEGAIIVVGSSTVYEIDEDGFISRSVALGWNESGNAAAVRDNILFVSRPSIDTIYRVNLDTFALGSTTSITANCDAPQEFMLYLEDVDGFLITCANVGTPELSLYSSSWTYIDQHVFSNSNDRVTMGEVDLLRNEVWTDGHDVLDKFTYNSTDISFAGSMGGGFVHYPRGLHGNYLYTADSTQDNLSIWDLTTETFVTSFALNWDGESFQIVDVNIASEQDQIWIGVAVGGTAGYVYRTSLSALLAGVTLTPGAGGEVSVDSDGDGVPDFVLVDVDGDGMVDWDPSVVPIQAENFAESATNFVQSFGFEPEVAGLLIAGFIVIVSEGVLFAATGRDGFMGVPAFVHGILVFVGVGVSTALGFIDLFYIYILAALVAISLGFTVARGTGGAAD